MVKHNGTKLLFLPKTLEELTRYEDIPCRLCQLCENGESSNGRVCMLCRGHGVLFRVELERKGIALFFDGIFVDGLIANALGTSVLRRI